MAAFECCATVRWTGKSCQELVGTTYTGKFVCVSPPGKPTELVGAFEGTWATKGREYMFVERVAGKCPSRVTAQIDLKATGVKMTSGIADP